MSGKKSKIKFEREIVYRDAMVEEYVPQALNVEEIFEELAADIRADPEGGNDFSEEFKRRFHEDIEEFMAGDPVALIAEQAIQDAEVELPKLGYPKRRQKIWARLASPRCDDDHGGASWIPAGKDWKTEDYKVKRGWVGTYGENYWLGREDLDPYSKHWKLIKLFRLAITFHAEKDPTRRENLAFRLGKFRERIRLHKFVRTISVGEGSIRGGNKSAALTRAIRAQDTDPRYAEMKRLVDDEGLPVREAARRLESLGKGTAGANKKLYERRKKLGT